jgi:3-deoxy-D-manno-octulosonate 8-phosphate phosphatase (KDO 8-P phosphatase)
MENLIPKFKNLKGFIFDIDGVMTNGQVLVNEEGHMLRAVNIKDGFAVQHAVKLGYLVAIVSGGKSVGMELRFKGLGVEQIFMGQMHKVEAVTEIIKNSGFSAEEFLYMGDDMPDMPVLKMVGIAACPKDAASDVLNICDYISPISGGDGCVRDVIERTLKIQQTWNSDSIHHW